MKGKLLAATLAMTTALSTPLFAQPAGNAATAPAEATPPSGAMHGPGYGHPGPRGTMGTGMGHGWDHGWGRGMGYGMDHGWGSRMGRRNAMRWRNPKEWCIDRLARRAARLAYMETKLDLTAEQRPLWDKLQKTASSEAEKERELCNSLKSPGTQTVLERVEHMQRSLKIRLAGIEAAMPDLEALYKALTPEQRAILDHPRRHW